jgi:hypothetical protein
MSIFTKPINEISFQDITSFCEQGIGEGINLDYKRDFPSSGLEKTISAFANTFGGVIIIGVEDEDSKPKPPFEGIEYKDKLEERVWNIIVDNIYPPVFPEIKVCPPLNNKAFVTIRVPQSNETPHALYNNTQVYIRTGNRNKPEDLATVEQIEWLRNRRERSEELRETLYRIAEERYQTICDQKKVRIEFAEFTLSFVPLYPQKPLMMTEEIEGVVNKMKVLGGGNKEFPRLSHFNLEPIQDGMIYFRFNKETGFITHTEINKFGLIFYKEDLGSGIKETPESETIKRIHLNKILDILDVSFESISKFYNTIGYWGLVEVKCSLSGLLGVRIVRLNSKDYYSDEAERINIAEKELSWEIVTSVSELNDNLTRQNKLLLLGKEISWSVGFKISEDKIEQKLKEKGRWVG